MFGRDLTVPQDWEEYIQVGKFFTKSYNPASPTQYGTTLMAKKHEALYVDWRTWCRTFGVVEINPTMDPTFDTPEGVKCTQFYGDLINKYKIVPPSATEWTWDEVTTAYGSGQTAIGMNYHRMLLDPAVVAKGGKSGYTLVPGQRQPDGNIARAPHYGTYFLSIPKYSTHPRWAWDFILHADSPRWQLEYAQYQYHGSRISYYKDPSVLAVFPDYWPVFSQSLPMGYARPRIEVFVNYSETLQEEIHKFLLGEQSADQALKNARKRVIQLFNDQGYYQKLGVSVPQS
jgi:multiple sugar transport system substrate-binding protein